MPEDTIFDSTNKGTLRPNAKPISKQGDTFSPIQLLNWDWEITLPENASPDDSITLFTIVVRQAVLSKNHIVLAVLRFWSHGKGCGLLHVTCGNHIRKLVFL
jgi:hypothetical protein